MRASLVNQNERLMNQLGEVDAIVGADAGQLCHGVLVDGLASHGPWPPSLSHTSEAAPCARPWRTEEW